jgi:predicted transcriptional regulator
VQIPLFGGGLINGVWLIFIGWFLHNAAIQSYQNVVVQDLLEGVPVGRLMQAHVPQVPATASVDAFINEYMMKSEDLAYFVYDGLKMIGMVTLDDVRKLPAEKRRQVTVQEIMTPSRKLIVVAPAEDASEAFYRLRSQDIRQMPVVDGTQVIGLLRRKDILRWLQFRTP